MKAIKKLLLESREFMPILIASTAVAITVSAFLTEQEFFKILPLYVSLGVMFLQSKAMRIAPLIGGINCILYTIVYLSYNLYGSAASTFFFSFPIQIATFINWTRRKSGASTRFKTLSKKSLFLIIAAMAVAYVPLYISNRAAGGAFVELDTLGAVVGFAGSILMLLTYSNYTHFQIFGCFISLTLFGMMIKTAPEQICYFCYTIYSTVCCIRAALNVSIIKRAQSEELRQDSTACESKAEVKAAESESAAK